MSDYRLMRRMSALSRRRVFTSIKWAPPRRLHIPTVLSDRYEGYPFAILYDRCQSLQTAAMQRLRSLTQTAGTHVLWRTPDIRRRSAQALPDADLPEPFVYLRAVPSRLLKKPPRA